MLKLPLLPWIAVLWTVSCDALSLVETGLRATRQRNKTTGHGKRRKQVTDTWDVVGLEGLTTSGFYGELGGGSHENRNDFRPNPINAIVVLHDPYRENNPNVKTLVILTNGPVSSFYIIQAITPFV